jgi:hypothetical protein
MAGSEQQDDGRQELHRLVDELRVEDRRTARRYLQYLCDRADPVLRALLDAPVDDEPVTARDAALLDEAHEDIASGQTSSHDEARRLLLGDR